ncbi:hypothetical protein Tco_0600374 [Tanacetum coccineum]|uniref:Retrovirus-related Pol polyprotein from transposon TNT 1-94-like beta-barrel domain-containing protein n=1 Tax=Tanacetum coccineum TaxID=301880 RepID=A0ABQ4WBJ4_9ASTR
METKMLFFLTMKKVASALTSQKPVVVETTELWEKEKQTKALQEWTENDFMCKNFILNGLSDDLYDYYNFDDVTAHKLWEALQKKYDTEEAGTKKYAVSRYLKFQMTDDKSVEAQSHELQKVAHEIIFEAMISEINLIGGSEGWWVDCGATIHVCYDRSLFKTYTAAFEDKKVLLGDHHTTNVAGIRNIELKFKSGKSSDPQRCYAHS